MSSFSEEWCGYPNRMTVLLRTEESIRPAREIIHPRGVAPDAKSRPALLRSAQHLIQHGHSNWSVTAVYPTATSSQISIRDAFGITLHFVEFIATSWDACDIVDRTGSFQAKVPLVIWRIVACKASLCPNEVAAMFVILATYIPASGVNQP